MSRASLRSRFANPKENPFIPDGGGANRTKSGKQPLATATAAGGPTGALEIRKTTLCKASRAG
jgi:hypothetical protein